MVSHDGTRSIPQERNAAALLTYSASAHIGLDCRGLATILNEAYLSMGIASRILTCLPKDTTDLEHHVVTAVYAVTLGKWLWMDPTFDAYITDSNGAMIDITEIRRQLIEQKPLRTNTPNVNGKSITTKEYLYGYIAKNIYWFQCPVVSTFDTETEKPGKSIDYVALVPKGYLPYGKQQSLRSGMAYFTTNGNYFWQPPSLPFTIMKE